MHTKSYSVPVELNKAMDMELETTVSNRYTIRFPKVIREKLAIYPGELVNVGLSNDHEALLISKAMNNNTMDNKMRVNENNVITIPVELR